MRGFRSYDKNELFNQIDNLSIERIENQIITKYGGRVIKVANVSNRYEIFDIVICSEVLEHIPDYENVIKEIFRLNRAAIKPKRYGCLCTFLNVVANPPRVNTFTQ